MQFGSWVSRTSILAALACAALAAPAHADGMRCGTKLVSDGDSSYAVKNACGDPDAASQRREFRTIRTWVNGPCMRQPNGAVTCGYLEERTVEVTILEWIYDFGPTQFVRFLTFEEGRLQRITTGGYGVKQT